MTIKIEFNSADLGPAEAGALVAFLMTLHPDAASEAVGRLGECSVTHCVGEVSVTHRVPSVEDLQALETGIPAQTAPLRGIKVYPAAPFDVEQHVGAEPATAEPEQRETSGSEVLARQAAALTPEQAFGGTRPFASATEATPPATAPAGTPAAPSPNTSTGPTATNTASPSDAPELDAEGLPWDERIHSSNHKRSANGVWMKRRGVNQFVDQKVRAELRENYPAPDAPETPAQRTVREAVEAGLVSPAEAGSTAAPVAPPPPPPVASAPASPPPPAAPASGNDFTEAMKLATGAQARGVITAADVLELAKQIPGITALRDLAAPANAGLVPQFRTALEVLIAGKEGAQ